MADEHKYSSLYSAIQSIARRPRRYSDSPFFREDSPTRRQRSAPVRRRSAPAPHEDSSASPFIGEDSPSALRERQAPVRASTQKPASFSIPFPLEDSPGRTAPPFRESYPASFIREDVPSVQRVNLRVQPSALDVNRASQRRTAPAPSETLPASPSIREESPARRQSEVAVRASTQQPRFSILPSPLNESRSSHLLGVYDEQGPKESRIINHGSEDKEVGEMLSHPSPEPARLSVSSQFDVNTSSPSRRESQSHVRQSTQQARFSIPPSPLNANKVPKTLVIYGGQVPAEFQAKAPDDEDEEFGQLYPGPHREQAQFSVSPQSDATRGSAVYRESQGPMRGSTQQGRSSIAPSTLYAKNGSQVLEAYDGQRPGQSQMMTPGNEGKAIGEARTRPSAEQAQFVVSPRLIPKRSSNGAIEVYDGLGGRESQVTNPEEAKFSSTMPSSMHALRSSQKGSSLAAESSVSPPRVTFLLPGEDAVHKSGVSFPDSDVSQEHYAGEEDFMGLPRLSIRNAKGYTHMVDGHESFLRVPSVLEPEDEAILREPHGLQMINGGPPASQVEAERSPRASSLLKIPSVMDNEPETYAKEEWGSSASPFVNPVIYGSEVDFHKSPEARQQPSQGAQRVELPRNTGPYLEGNDVQALSASSQAPRFSSIGAGQSSRNTSPSRKFSQAPGQTSFPVSIDVKEDEVNQGRTSYMPLDPTMTPLPGSFQNPPGMESMQEQLVSPSQTPNQVARPSIFAPPFDISNEVAQSSLDSMQTSLPETSQYVPGMENMLEDVVSLSQKLSQVSRPSTFVPPFDSVKEVTQGPRKSYMPSDPMQNSLPETFQYAPRMENELKQAISPSQKFSQVSRPSAFAPPFDSGNEGGQRARKSYMPLDPMQTSLPESFQYAPVMESMQEQVVSPSQKFSQVSRPSTSAAPFDKGNEDAPRKSYISLNPMQTSLPESSQYAPGMESMQEKVVSPLHKFSQVSRASTLAPAFDSGNDEQSVSPSGRFSQLSRPSLVLPSIGSEEEVNENPRTSYMPWGPMQASLCGSLPDMESVQEQVRSPSGRVSQASRRSTMRPTVSENKINESPKTSFMSLDPMHSSLPGSFRSATSMESEEQLAPPSRKFGQSSPSSSAPMRNEDEFNQGPRTSSMPLDSMRTFSQGSFQSARGMESVQKQLASPSYKFSQGSMPSSLPLIDTENGVNQSPRTSRTLVESMRTSLSEPSMLGQRPSSLSFSKQIQKRASIRSSLAPMDTGSNPFSDIGNSTSDSSSDEAVQDRRLNLETVSRPSFAAKLNEQQSMVRPWDTEMLTDTQRRASEATFDKSDGFSDYSLKDPNGTGLRGSENANDSGTFFRTSVESEAGTLAEGTDEQPQKPSDSGYAGESLGFSEQAHQQQEEEANTPSPLEDSDKMRSFSTKGSRKSMVQEFIYPTSSSPRQSFRESLSPRADQQESLFQEANYHSTSPRFSVRQSLGSSKKDLTQLQTQEFMYSPSLATTEQSLDGQGQAMIQSTVPEMAEDELEYQDSLYSLPSRRQSVPQLSSEELYSGELQYEDPTYPSDTFDHDIEGGNDQEDLQSLSQQHSEVLMSGASNENELDDEECFDDVLAAAQQEVSGIASFEDKDEYVEDPSAPLPKDDLHSESFANLEHSLGSFKRAFGSSTSFVKVPFGASELSYEGFAEVQFMEPTAGIWPVVWKSVAMQDLIRFSQDPITQPLLQRLAAAPHKQCAVTSFTHLLAYMGVVPTEQDLAYHIQQILMLGIKYSDFRDEIFCQICKQTTANPNSWSNSRGWQAMALCVGMFAPSSTFRPFLEAHLLQVAGNFVSQWPGDTLSEGMSNPSKAAEYCLARFQKLLQAGSRRLPPLHAEINAVEKMETVRVNFYLPDDTFKVLDLDPMATAEEVTTQLVQLTGLSDPEYYGIFEVLYGDMTLEKALSKNSYIMELLSDWNKATIPPLEKDLRLIAKAKVLFEKHLLCLPSTNFRLFDEQAEEDDTFSIEMDPSKTEMLFKRRIFIEELSNCSSDVQNAVQNFDYVQAVRDVTYGVYPVEEHDAVMLGSLQLRADSSFFENLEEALTDEMVRKFGPKIYVEGNEREWKAALLRTAAALPPEEDMSICINDYIDFLRSRCTLYGSCWYYVKQKADPRLPHEMFVAINTAGVYFVQVKTKEQLLHMQFTEICSWGYSSISFSLVTGNMTYNHDHRLITRQGTEIGATLQKYINQLQW